MDAFNSVESDDNPVSVQRVLQPSTGKSAAFSGNHSVHDSSPKRSKKAVQKKVITVPISDIEGSKQKGETTPPSDSWAWRKYGQKPIKGSPYPRGYYRCSSSKGCPARKQVERSRLDPTMLLITYACEHNHPLPAAGRTPGQADETKPQREEAKKPHPEPESGEAANKFELDDDVFAGNGVCWFSDVADHAILSEAMQMDGGDLGCTQMGSDGSGVGGGGEVDFGEDESFFADLAELPEGSVVFRRGGVFAEEECLEEEQRRAALRTAPIG
ncbi:probable WRKY transcription factor 65 [Nymphaea colorata]|nr:probable WRKY transcription factor 65 [Nymphaea colorata]